MTEHKGRKQVNHMHDFQTRFRQGEKSLEYMIREKLRIHHTDVVINPLPCPRLEKIEAFHHHIDLLTGHHGQRSYRLYKWSTQRIRQLALDNFTCKQKGILLYNKFIEGQYSNHKADLKRKHNYEVLMTYINKQPIANWRSGRHDTHH